MTEMETLERAKMYMEKLANGINPVDDTVIPDTDAVNNVRLSRCFFYVADVLRQVIDNGGVAAHKKADKLPFMLQLQQREAFPFSEKPIPISEIAKRINGLRGHENMETMNYTVIRDWLMSLNMLEETVDSEGKNMKRPTARGESMGITLDARTGNNGTYFVVVYELSAQHFILDNLEAIIAFKCESQVNQGKPWSAEQDQCLRELHQKGMSAREIALVLKRNSGSVRARQRKLGLP